MGGVKFRIVAHTTRVCDTPRTIRHTSPGLPVPSPRNNNNVRVPCSNALVFQSIVVRAISTKNSLSPNPTHRKRLLRVRRSRRVVRFRKTKRF